MKPLLLVLSFFALISCGRKNNDLIIACGWDEVFISDISLDVPEKVWSWSAEVAKGLPVSFRNKFLTTDECKPVNRGKEILITSSGGGVALVRVKDSLVLFYASVPNAHSAELLPGKRIVVAASLSPEGNRINIYDIDNPGVIITGDTLYSAHGVAWDKKRNVLWALGHSLLKEYDLLDWNTDKPSLKITNIYELPGKDGHDLAFLDNRSELCITTGENVWLFDLDERSFKKHPLIGDEVKVKSISYNAASDQLAYMKASDDSWWGYYIRFSGSDRAVYLPFEKLYKVRWLY